MMQVYCPADSTAFRFALLIGTETVSGRSLVAFIEECPRCAAKARSILTDQGQRPDDPTLGGNYKRIWEAIFQGEQARYPLVATP